jgi:hypothetical protein
MRKFDSAQSWRPIPTATLCIVNFSLTAFSQQIVPPPSFPVGPRPSNQTSETSNPGGQSPAQSATPHPEARPIPSPGTNDLNEENLLGAEYGPTHYCTLDRDPDNPDPIGETMKRPRESKEFLDLLKVLGSSSHSFQRNNLLPRRHFYNTAKEKTEFEATWSTTNGIISIKSVTIMSRFHDSGSLYSKRTISGTCDLVLKKCGHIEKHILHIKPTHVGKINRVRELQCIKYSLKEIEWDDLTGQERTLTDRSYQGAGFFAGNLVLMDISEAKITSVPSKEPLPDSQMNQGGESNPLSTKEVREKLQEEAERLIKDSEITNDQKTEKVIDLAASLAEISGRDPHDVIQDLRRNGWTSSEKEMYNHPSLVHAHYFLKGQGLAKEGVLGLAAGEAGMSLYNDLLKRGGSWLADPFGEIDNRPASNFDEDNRRWYRRGVQAGWNSEKGKP